MNKLSTGQEPYKRQYEEYQRKCDSLGVFPLDYERWLKSPDNELAEPEHFQCPDCQRKSYSLKDIEHQYCGACDKYFK